MDIIAWGGTMSIETMELREHLEKRAQDLQRALVTASMTEEPILQEMLREIIDQLRTMPVKAQAS